MQYIVNEKGYNERLTFYKYVHSKYKLKDKYKREYMLNSNYPFVVDTDEHILWICSSITCLSCAAQNNRIINASQFYKSMI